MLLKLLKNLKSKAIKKIQDREKRMAMIKFRNEKIIDSKRNSRYRRVLLNDIQTTMRRIANAFYVNFKFLIALNGLVNFLHFFQECLCKMQKGLKRPDSRYYRQLNRLSIKFKVFMIDYK